MIDRLMKNPAVVALIFWISGILLGIGIAGMYPAILH
jgi:hypothetical protein